MPERRMQRFASLEPLCRKPGLILGFIFSLLFVLSAIYESHKALSWFSSSAALPVDVRQTSNEPLLTMLHNLMNPSWKVPSNGRKMPPLDSFKLTKEMVSKSVKDNVIIVTFGNHAYKDFILNWVMHMRDLSLFNFLIGAMDAKLLEALYWKGVPVFDMGSHTKEKDLGWGSSDFHVLGREKVLLIDALLEFGYDILMSDTDVVWLKNPLPYVARYPDADILTSTDQLSPTVADDNLDIWQQVDSAYNIGIFYWRPTKNSRKFLKRWKNLLSKDDKIWDQGGFNDIMQEKVGPSVRGANGVVYAFDGKLKLGLLPASIFCSGHTYFVQGTAEKLRLLPYAVHATFQYGGTEGKRHRLREKMLFHDPPEYYDEPGVPVFMPSRDWIRQIKLKRAINAGGFLSFKPSIPKSLLLDGPDNLLSHFNLVNVQLKQIRTALAVASILGRTLVMPRFWCRLDRLHYPHPGILPGTLIGKPFMCPLDHVFEIDAMLENSSVEEFGQTINFREYSFLENPSLPKHVKESWVDVQLCEVGMPNCYASHNLSSSGILTFPANSSEQTFREVFSAFKNIKIIQFSSMQDAFQGFARKDDDAKFRNRVNRYTGIWCCVEDHIPGHIYYDMYWDEKPNWQPKPPQTDEEDHQPL